MQGTLAPAPTWGPVHGGRGFWTKRRKSAVSLLSVVALLAGIAVAYKLFDRTVPNNVVRDAAVFNFLIEKQEAGLDSGYEVADATNPIYDAAGANQYPGDTRRVDVRIHNTNAPARDASFEMYVTDLIVRDGLGNVVAPASTNYNRFVAFWTITVAKENVLQVLESDTATDYGRFTQACTGGLTEINAAAPCQLGVIRAAGSDTGLPLNQATDVRDYRFDLTEIDTGEDQSFFKGWELDFDLVFNARIPAVPDDVLIGER